MSTKDRKDKIVRLEEEAALLRQALVTSKHEAKLWVERTEAENNQLKATIKRLALGHIAAVRQSLDLARILVSMSDDAFILDLVTDLFQDVPGKDKSS